MATTASTAPAPAPAAASGSGKFKIVHVTDPAKFDDVLKEYLGKPDLVLLSLFTGANKPETGESWCGDCRVADPVMEKAWEGVEDETVLIRCTVERMPYRAKDYLYRTHEAVKLTAVPTLLRWGKTNPTARLVEGQCANADMIADLLEAE